MKNNLNTEIRYIKGVGPKRAKAFAKLGLRSIEDLLYYFPRRYEDRTNFVEISRIQEGQIQTIKAEILNKRERRARFRRGFSIIELTLSDNTGKLSCIWFNQPYLSEYFKVGENIILYGKVENYAGKLQMSNPEFELVSGGEDDALNVGRIVPVYTLPEGMTQRYFRKMFKRLLDEYLPQLKDSLSYDIRERNKLLNLAKSLLNIHFPENPDAQKQAYERLAFEEFFLFQIPLVLRKLRKKEKRGIAHKTEGRLLDGFLEGLPFKLTASQDKVVAEIKSDMAALQPMQRLLQGDVGSGKTVVATIASIIAVQGNYQVAFMVPTEILAKQHFEKISSQLQASGFKLQALKISLLTSSVNKKEKEKLLRQIKEGKIDLVIGTHALLQETVDFKNLGLVIIDEQHKFGVGQRALLPRKGLNPDTLIMTATPIPRTLAITLYGDLDLSVITELPPGRLPVKTLSFSEDKVSEAYDIARNELQLGHQAYIIYPVIEESYALDIAGAKKMFEQLKTGEFKEFKLGLIHGQLKQEAQDEVMAKFKNKEIDILISTTILEVGIDIANATCMIIEHAERFGLSQLHQLRGRIGRGKDQSYCLLVADNTTEQAGSRIAAMVKYNDGFRISEEDLKIRGPGEFFGRRQHGLTELKIGNPLTQMQLLKSAREEAMKLLDKDRHLQERQNYLLKEKLLQRFPEYENLIMVG